MNKPISTWTQTFYKLGYTLRRIWHDEPDCTNNYTPLAIEVLEDRQMLSGFGGDDPLGGGGTGGTGDGSGEFGGGSPTPPSGDGTGGNGAASPASPGGNHSPDRFNGLGDFSDGLQLPGYWQAVLPAHYSFMSNSKIDFRGTVADGVYTFSSRKDDTSPDDNGVVTLSHYEFTVTVSRQGGNYHETLTGQMTRYTLTSLDTAGCDGFTGGSSYDFSSQGRITYTSNLNYTFTQNFNSLMLTGLTINVTENTDTQFNWNAEEHKHFAPPTGEYAVTSDATFLLTGATHGYDHASFQATVTPSLITFQSNGSGYHRSGARGTIYANASGTPNESSWVTTTVSGTTTAETGNLAGQAEGHRMSITMDGTVKTAFSNDYNFSGGGKILPVATSSVGNNGWVADATIIKTQNSSSRFQNDLTTDFESERFIINAEILTGISQGTSGQQSLAGQFIVNLPDDAHVRNTNRETQTASSRNNNSGNSSGQSARTLRYKPDGTIVASVQQPDSLTQHIDVDRYDESTNVFDVYVYAANGFTRDRFDTAQDSTTTGTIDLTMTDDVTYTTNQVGYLGEHHRVGKQATTGTRDLTMETNATSIHLHHQEHQMSSTGSLVEVLPSGGSGNTNGGSGTGGGSSLTGPGDADSGSQGGSGDALPPPSNSGAFNFTDKRIEVTNVTLRTVSNEDSSLDLSFEYFADGSIVIKDKTVIDTGSEFRPGSQATINKERWHTPLADSDPNNQNSGYTHSNEQQNFFGFSKSKLTNDLTWKLTPILPGITTNGSGNGEVTASTAGITGATPDSEKFTVTTTGTEVFWIEERLDILSTEHGSQWLDQLTISDGTKTTLYSSGNWSGSGTTNDYGTSTTTTEYFADKSVEERNTGNSSHEHTSSKTLTTTSHRGISSGMIPAGYPDPHDRSEITVGDAMGLKDAWTISINSDNRNQNLDDIEDARDSLDGTFSIQRDFEKSVQQIHASETGSTDYNFLTTYKPKPPSANNSDGSTSLVAPSVGTGTDAAGEVKNMWKLYDITMDGTLTERSDVKADTTSSEKLIIKFKFDQKEGHHTTDVPTDFLWDIANAALPEFLNRNETRSFAFEINDYETSRTQARTVDNKETKFETNGKVTRKTLPNAAPAGGSGSGSGANQTTGDASSGGDDYLYHEFLTESKIKLSKFEQEAVWMDSIRGGHGYFALNSASITPNADQSSSSTETLNITRNLTVVESLGSYFGIDGATDGSGTTGGSSGSTSGGTSGTSTPPSGSSGGSSTYLPATGDGSMTGTFDMVTTDDRRSDFQWKQTNFSRSANVTHGHAQSDVTKIGHKALNTEHEKSEYSATFLTDGRTSYTKITTINVDAEWDNVTFGSNVAEYRTGGSKTVGFHSNFSGTYSNDTVNTEGDTGESIDSNIGKTMKTETTATADATGFASQTTTEVYAVSPALYLNNEVTQKVTTETINEVVAGTYVGKIDLVNPANNGPSIPGQILLTRETKVKSVLSFTMLPTTTHESPPSTEVKSWGDNFDKSQLNTFAYGSADHPYEYNAVIETLWTRVWGGVKLVFGILEVVGGVLALKSVVGAPFGVIAIVHGLDTMYAGARQLVTGEVTETLTKRLANTAFLSVFQPANAEEKKELEKFGEGVDALVGIVGGLGGAGAAFSGAKQLKNGAAAGKMAAGLDDAGEAAGYLANSRAGQNLRAAADASSDTRLIDFLKTKCFARDTLVSTEKGLRPIGCVDIGEKVYSYDFSLGEWKLRTVTDRIDSIYEGPVVTIEVGASNIETTIHHPFWVAEGHELATRPSPRNLSKVEDQGKALTGRWVNSHDLRAGDVIIGREGGRLVIDRVSQRYEGSFAVSNLTIGEFHNYTVGSNSILVHNESICEAGRAALQDILDSGAASYDEIARLIRGFDNAQDVLANIAKNSTRFHMHHAWPKYLGGPTKQDLVRLPMHIHDAYHKGLDKILNRRLGSAYYDSLSDAARARLEQQLASYTIQFDARYGTSLWEAMLRNGFPGV